MDIVAGKFPTEVELERIATLKKYAKLYCGEHFQVLKLHEMIKKQFKNKADIIYLSQNLPAYVSDFYGDFVAGDTDQLVISAGTGNAEQEKFVETTVYENDLKEKIPDMGTEQSEFGFYVLLGWTDDANVLHIDMVGQDQYFPQSDGSVIFLSYYTRSNGITSTMFALAQKYELIGRDCVITRSGWECDNMGVVRKQISMGAMQAVIGGGEILEMDRIPDLDDLPIRQVDNGKRTKYGFGKSDYNDIMPQVAEINERSTHIAVSLLKNLTAKMQLPRDMFDVEGKVKAFEAISVSDKTQGDAKYITNANPLIEDARNHILDQVKVVSLLTAVPMQELLKTAMPERVESLRIGMFSAERRTARKRAKIKRALQDMFRIGGRMAGVPMDIDIKIEFSEVLPKDDMVQAQTEDTKVAAGLSSRRSAIMRLNNIDEDEAEKEMAQIADEDKIAGIIQGAPPVVTTP